MRQKSIGEDRLGDIVFDIDKPVRPLRNFEFLLKDVSRLHLHNFERHATELNLTLEQCKVLSYLQRNEGISQVRLAYLTETDPMTLARILDRLEGNGLIVRSHDPTDLRVRRLFLQPSASPVLQEIWRISDQVRDEMLSGLAGVERAQLINLLQRIRLNLFSLTPCAAESSGMVPRQARKSARMHVKLPKS